jgi:hypothetical protein
VGIEEGEAFAVHEVLARKIGNQRGLPRPGLANHVHVGAAVGPLDAKTAPLIAEVGLANDGDGILKVWPVHEARLAIGGREERRANVREEREYREFVTFREAESDWRSDRSSSSDSSKSDTKSQVKPRTYLLNWMYLK